MIGPWNWKDRQSSSSEWDSCKGGNVGKDHVPFPLAEV